MVISKAVERVGRKALRVAHWAVAMVSSMVVKMVVKRAVKDEKKV